MTMVSGEINPGLVLSGFGGEAPTVPEHLLEGTVSPDALNIDYRDGTLRKRGGVARLSRHNVLDGGLWVRRSGADWCGIVDSAGSLAMSGTPHTYECVVVPLFSAVDSDYQVWRHITTGTEGTSLWLINVASAYKWRLVVKTSAGTSSVTSSVSVTDETPKVVTAAYDSGTNEISLNVGGTVDTVSLGGATYTTPSGKMRFGGESASDDGAGAVLSDFRVWGGTVAATLQSTLRALLPDEQTAALLAWWRFQQSDPLSDSSGNDEDLAAGGLFVGGYVPGADGFAPIDVLVSAKFSGTWYLVMAGTRDMVYSGQMRANTVLNVQARLGNYGPDASTGRGPFRMQAVPYREYVVFMNGYGENTLVAWSAIDLGQLSYAAPTSTTAPDATAAGSGGSLSAGDYLYHYAVYNSVTGVESAVGLFSSSVTAVLNDAVTLDLTSNGFMPDRYFPGADTLRIYRTEADGAAFYLLTEEDIAATTYEDTASDASIAVPANLKPAYAGYALPSRFCVEMDDRLFLGNQAGYESRLVYTERSSLGAFYAENYIDVGYGDGDVLVGGYGVADRAVVFKRRSAWLAVSGGGEVAIYKLAAGVGCVQHATIAAAHSALYWMGEGGVYTMPLPLGSGSPQSLTGGQWRDFFTGFTDADYENCAGVWDPINERYLLTLTMDGVRKVLVFTASSQAWALWEGDIESFAVLGGGGTNKVYCGWRGHLSELNSGLGDGGNPHSTEHEFSGTVSSGTANTLTDSTATWTVPSAVVNGRLSGLQNVTVTVMDAAGANVQERTIVGNTGTALTVATDWDTNPAAGWTYMLGAIEATWRSPKMGMDRWDRRKALDRVEVLNVPPSSASGDESTVFVSVDDGTEETFDNAADSRLVEVGVRAGHGREFVVGVRQTSADMTFEVGAVALPFLPGEGY